MKLLIFGDVFGRPGREAVAYTVPRWKKEFSPDIVIANGENLSHGRGISEITIREMQDAGVDVITGGNHSPEGKNALVLLADETLPLLRPLNMPPSIPGRGFMRKQTPAGDVLVMNAIAQAHMRIHYDSPYRAIEAVLEENKKKQTKIIIVDWHAETTSEKTALGWFLDGRVSLIYGTHTHLPTDDLRILPKGTGIVGDIGMTGPYNSIIGENIERRLKILVEQEPAKPDVAEAPPYIVNAILAEVDNETGTCLSLTRLREIINHSLATDPIAPTRGVKFRCGGCKYFPNSSKL